MCMRATKALTRLQRRAGSSKACLLTDVIRAKIHFTGSYYSCKNITITDMTTMSPAINNEGCDSIEELFKTLCWHKLPGV